MISVKYLLPKLLLPFLFLTYCFASLFRAALFADLLTAVILAAASVILVVSARHAGRFSRTFWFFGIALIIWSVIDMLWAVSDHLLQHNPGDQVFFLYAYTLPNLFLAIASLNMVISYRRKRKSRIILLDVLLIALAAIGYAWLMLSHQLSPQTAWLDPVNIATLFYITSSIIAFTSQLVWLLSEKLRKLPVNIIMIAFGVFIYAATDLFYSYALITGIYIPNTLIDITYMLSVIVLSLAVYQTSFPSGIK